MTIFCFIIAYFLIGCLYSYAIDVLAHKFVPDVVALCSQKRYNTITILLCVFWPLYMIVMVTIMVYFMIRGSKAG